MKAKMMLVAALAVLAPGAAQAQTPAPSPTIEVTLGPAVSARTRDLGASELEAERRSLVRDLQPALARSGMRQARLVIADIQPNRPTPAQLGRSPGLNAASIGLGGAAITGEVVRADGTTAPIRFRYFQQDLQLVTDLSTWSGAEEAFAELAQAIGEGQAPYTRSAWPPPAGPETVTGTRLPG